MFCEILVHKLLFVDFIIYSSYKTLSLIALENI